MLTEDSVISHVGITEHRYVEVRRTTRICRDGVVVSETHHRHALAPGDPFETEDPWVQGLCKAAWGLG